MFLHVLVCPWRVHPYHNAMGQRRLHQSHIAMGHWCIQGMRVHPGGNKRAVRILLECILVKYPIFATTQLLHVMAQVSLCSKLRCYYGVVVGVNV